MRQAFEAIGQRADEERAAIAREMWETPEINRVRKKFVEHLMKLGMSRAWAYQQAKVAIEGVKAIKERRTRQVTADRKYRSLSRDRKSAGAESDFDPTSAWTDEEIEAEMGAKIATVVQGIGLDLRQRRGECSRQ